jgi:hypothetical protein
MVRKESRVVQAKPHDDPRLRFMLGEDDQSQSLVFSVCMMTCNRSEENG